MKKEHAEKLVQFVEKFEIIFAEASYVTDFFESHEEKVKVRKVLGGMFENRFQLEDILL